MKCPNKNCNVENPQGSKYCNQCGTKLEMTKKCLNPDCGADHLPVMAKFCPDCGQSLEIKVFSEESTDGNKVKEACEVSSGAINNTRAKATCSKSMSKEELYAEGVELLSKRLENTAYTGTHSEDIRANIYSNYFLPAANAGYPPAIKEVVKYLMLRNDKSKALSWCEKYKEITHCSQSELIQLFGPSLFCSFLFK